MVKLYWECGSAKLYQGDCREVMIGLADISIDAVVADPPYELGFMGKSWDQSGIAYNVDVWKEALRVLKPGGHLLAFGGSRTYHRLASAVEDAGFEIRDQIMWLYGSGFPKSMDVSKAIDKAAGAEREVIGVFDPRSSFDGSHRSSAAINSNWRDAEGRTDTRDLSKKVITAAATEAAKQWEGWGTQLKPAHEPIVVARKPLIGTVAQNALEFSTGALNIEGCRIESQPIPINRLENWSGFGQEKRPKYVQEMNTVGRWPANVIHDGSDEVLEEFAKYGDHSSCMTPSKADSKGKIFGGSRTQGNLPMDSGSVARFFYCAKASGEDRNEGIGTNNHPTVKPTELMRYLCRLVTPPNGTVLDPFCGSGSTGKAALYEGINFVGIEASEEYCAIAEARMKFVLETDSPLFRQEEQGNYV